MDIKKIVRDHVDITYEEIESIFKRSNWVRFTNKLGKPFEISHQGFLQKINEHGYRADKFDGGDGIVFLGCSLTQGYALEEHETWPWIVGKHFDMKVWNLAQDGTGDDVCFINALEWISKLKPKVVCMLIPPPGRFLIYEYTDNSDLYYWYEGREEFTLFNLPDNPKYPWLYNDKNLYLSTLKNVMSIKMICGDIPFVVDSSMSNMKDMDKFPKAKDGKHPGPVWHKKIALNYINEIEKYF